MEVETAWRGISWKSVSISASEETATPTRPTSPEAMGWSES